MLASFGPARHRGLGQGRHGGLPLPPPRAGIFRVVRPPRGIVQNVLPKAVHRFLAADDVLVIIALPQATGKWCPTELPDAVDVAFRGHRFVPMYNVRQRQRRRGNPLWLPWRQRVANSGRLSIVIRRTMATGIRAATGGRPYANGRCNNDDAVKMVWHDHECIDIYPGIMDR